MGRTMPREVTTRPGTTTAVDLILALSELPPDTPILAYSDDPHGWYLNLTGHVTFNPDEDTAAVIETTNNYDPRQW